MAIKMAYTGWYFSITVCVIYLITATFNLSKVFFALDQFKIIMLKILPVLLLIFILMVLTNYFINPKILTKYMGKNSGIKGWIIAIIAGIISTGPIYMWYPLLNDLQKQGMRTGLIATFLYNRAVKIPLLPMLIIYFGLTYSIVLLTSIVFVSVAQGIATEKIMEIIE